MSPNDGGWRNCNPEGDIPGDGDALGPLCRCSVRIVRSVVAVLTPREVAADTRALGVAWIVIVPAEMLGVDSGLGYAKATR
jgi:hypothetical protein